MKKTNDIEVYREARPLIALRGKVLFPKTVLNFDVGRPMSVSACETALSNDSLVIIAPQKNAFIDYPKKSDIYSYGVLAKIKTMAKDNNGNVKISAEAVERVKIVGFTDEKRYFCAVYESAPYITEDNEVELSAYFRTAKSVFLEYTLFDKRITKDMISLISYLKDANEFIDNALSVLQLKEDDALSIFGESDTVKRLDRFAVSLSNEIEILKMEKKIAQTVRKNIDNSQKEFYLREQIKAIHTELGDDEEEDALYKSFEKKKLPKEVEDKVKEEIARMEKINPSSPDYSIILNYLDWIKELPFKEATTDTSSLNKAKKILDADHFGLDKVKERIIEYIAVLQLTKKINGPIICFVGPPGSGKTSVASSIARALGRKFVRMSLGGVKDEAEIRGHRRTYVGAMPGRIITGMKNAGSINPVFLLDEIDKMSSDIHGDPASALLEVLDPEQNVTFRDRFMDIPYDLSKVMFITTANSLDTIPYPLLDRMEIIELTGYTNEEKMQIAKRYLIPKQIEKCGLKDVKVKISDDAIRTVIEEYTMEAGVRNLERELGSLLRKIAVKVSTDKKIKTYSVEGKDVSEFLGVKKHLKDLVMDKDEIGATTGLAWTSVGGTTLTIEVSLYPGKGDILLTGKLGDVMKESARTAISYIKSNADKYGIKAEDFEKNDIHIHVPEGATPKDGPSAGITMATAILSAFTKKSVKCSVAMTGEITLRGKVLPIGGLKEKSLAAFRRGIETVIIPKGNEIDLAEIPDEVKDKVKFIPTSSVDEVFKIAINF